MSFLRRQQLANDDGLSFKNTKNDPPLAWASQTKFSYALSSIFPFLVNKATVSQYVLKYSQHTLRSLMNCYILLYSSDYIIIH